jgi:TonB family protein
VRGPLLSSLLVHVALVAALFVIRPPTPIVIGGPESVEVALLDPSQLPRVPSVAPTPPAPKPAIREPEPLPDEEDGVRIDEPKPRRPPAEPPRETPPQRPQTAQPVTLALPSARIGTTGLSGSVGVDAADFAFTYYLVQVRDRVARNWSPPAGMRAGVTPKATVYFRITRDGRLSDVRLETGSGEEFFDRAALRAVQLSEPLPHLPAGYTGSRLGVYFGFEYRQP